MTVAAPALRLPVGAAVPLLTVAAVLTALTATHKT